MKIERILVLAVALIAGPAGKALAMPEPLFETGGPDFSAALFSDFNVSSPSLGAQTGDYFTISGSKGAFLEDFHWAGAYGAGLGPPGTLLDDDFTIRIFEVTGGVPQIAPLLEYSGADFLGGVDRTLNTDGNISGFSVYNYEVDIDPYLIPSGNYFLSIVNNTNSTDEAWLWATQDDSVGQTRQRAGDGVAWAAPSGRTMSFAVTGEQIPAPPVWVLMTAGLLLIASHRRGRKRTDTSLAV